MSNSHHSMHKEPRVTVEDRSHNGHNGTKDVNIVVVGKKGVGKTAIVVRYLTRRFIGDYDSQMEAMYEHADTVDGKPVNMHILDTAWRIDDKQIEVHEDAVRWADGVMLVYSITDSNSFDRLSEIADHALACRGDSKLVMALVASKCDLLHQKRVSDTRAAQFCAEYNCLFYETSASDSYGEIENAFTSVCRQVKLIHKKREKLSKLMQSPAVSAKLQIRNSLQNFVEKKWRRRTSTM